jgi:dienelactone hydrolase/Tol biopolymer transport system component
MTPAAAVAIGAAASPAFTRDGQAICFLCGSSLRQIARLDVRDGTVTPLTAQDERVAFLSRAPGDDRIVYGIDAGGDERQQLWLLADGVSRRLTDAPEVIHEFGAWSPDGTHIAYTANDRDPAHFDVLVMELATGTARLLLHGTHEMTVCAWSPAGDRLAAIADHGFGEQTLWIIPTAADVDGGVARAVATPQGTRWSSVRWGADGTSLLGLTDLGGHEFLRLGRIEAATGAVTWLYSAPGRDVEAWALSPDRTWLATIENDAGAGVLRIGALADERPVCDGLPDGGGAGGLITDPAWSPDGTRLACVGASATDPPALFLCDASGGAATCIWRPASPPGGAASASPPGGAVSASSPGGAASASPPGGAVSASPPGGAASASPPGGAASASSPGGAVSASSPGGAASASSPGGAASASPPGGAVSASPPGGALTMSPAGGAPAVQPAGGGLTVWPATGMPAPPRPFARVGWTGADGLPIPGWLALPAAGPPDRGYPAVIWVHGGPAAQTRAGFSAEMQALLAHGYAVLMPNVRGSTGYGRAYAEADDGARRLDAVADLAQGQRWLAARPDIDATAITVMGQSYGGYMVLAALTEYPTLWRSGIDFYGISDFATLLAGTGPWRRAHRAAEYGDLAGDAALFARISPLRHVARIAAPLLVLHGARDPRVPISESEQLVAALRARGAAVRYLRFDYAGHGFTRQADRVRALSAVLAFLAAPATGA